MAELVLDHSKRVLDPLGLVKRSTLARAHRNVPVHAVLSVKALARPLVVGVGEDFGLLVMQQRVGLDLPR